MSLVTVAFSRSALAVGAAVLAAAFTPPVPMPPSQWTAEHLVVPDGEYKGRRVDLSLTPYLAEPMDMLGPDTGVNEVAVRKAAQTGFTLMLLGLIGHSIDRDPCDMMVVQPTDSALTDFNSMKLSRTIEASPVLAAKVRAQTARLGTASTTYEKKFGDCSLVLGIATSAADLSSKTIKKGFLDEIDRYPADVDGQGSPIELVDGRQTMFKASATWKRLLISTPTIDGASAIDDKFQAGDQRYWHVVCPHCGGKFPFAFGPHFRFNRTFPHAAHYVAPCCGSIIEGWQKNELVRHAGHQGGGWVATVPGPGRAPTYHFDALSSPFVPWDDIAAKFVAAGDDPEKLKPFYNLVLGLPYEIKGDAPDAVVLMERRGDYKRGHIPPGALILTVAADVQMRGIYYEVLAHGPDKQTWTVEADYLDGATTDVGDGAFAALSELYARAWPDAYGNRWRHDEFGIDSGYRTQVVYEFTRRHPGAKALKGADGWGVPSLGVATDQDVDYRGRRIKGGAKLRAVGTWPLKATFFSRLALGAHADGATVSYPPGYCHFGRHLDENYFAQLTAEYLIEERFRGRPRKVWKVRNNRENHFLDCRVYNMALADAYLTSFTADDWARLAKDRGIPADLTTPDLFAPRAFTPLQPVAGASAATTGSPVSPVAVDPVAAMFAGLERLNRGM